MNIPCVWTVRHCTRGHNADNLFMDKQLNVLVSIRPRQGGSPSQASKEWEQNHV